MNNFKYLVGNKNINQFSIEPYSKVACHFLSDLSKELSSIKKISEYPDIRTFAFFIRKQNIDSLKNKFLSEQVRLGLGLIFHITPSNIPTNFAYSLTFGLLTGNSNIVKVPSKKFEQINIICKTINRVLKKHKTFKKMITIVRYKGNDDYTKKISSICNGRLIWGGDNTIDNIRKFSIRHRSTDLAFADRYSLCIIDSEKISKLNKNDIRRLAENFYNDTYTVDQNACSSPHLILWLGKLKNQARLKFLISLKDIVDKKYNLNDAASVEKYTKLCNNILNLKNIKNHQRFGGSIYTITLKNLNKNIHNLRGKWGFFYEHEISNLNQLKRFINSKYQTLTYFGINKSVLKNFILKNKFRGIDRIVPIGQALNIGLFWDGYDLNKILTRVVDIK
jgi:hypothetical protein